MIAVVAGGSGLVGRALLASLLADPYFTKVISFGRKSLGIDHPKFSEVRAEISALGSLGEELKGDCYFCCLGTTIKVAGSKAAFTRIDYDAVVDFARIARKNEASSFNVVSAVGANPSSLFFYNQIKGATEDALRVLNFKRLLIFRPGLLLGERKENRPGEKFMGIIAERLPRFMRKSWATEVDLLARQMVQEVKGVGPSRIYFADEIGGQ